MTIVVAASQEGVGQATEFPLYAQAKPTYQGALDQ